jgi:hypothetical protein
MTTELTMKVRDIALRNNIVAYHFKRGYLEGTPYVEMLEKVVVGLEEDNAKKTDLLMKYAQKFGAIKDS